MASHADKYPAPYAPISPGQEIRCAFRQRHKHVGTDDDHEQQPANLNKRDRRRNGDGLRNAPCGQCAKQDRNADYGCHAVQREQLLQVAREAIDQCGG